jgi:NADPH:quinone reductase
MKALRFREFGLPSALRIDEMPRPEPRDGEALVQVKAAAINPSDVKNVSGFFFCDDFAAHSWPRLRRHCGRW